MSQISVMLPSEIIYKPLTISQITCDVKQTLEGKYHNIIVEGEISNYKKHSSGHSYLSLIEGDHVLQCVCWKSVHIPTLLDGMKIICTGKLTAYTGRSQFQLVIQSVSISGKGDLHKIFQELKNKLEKEGLFALEHKKPLPTLPKKIGVITGANSDALHDILIRMEQRLVFHTIIYPVLVQGPASPNEIKQAIEFFNNINPVDVIILARGGGSLEDLASFNDEITVRAVYDSNVPIITAVGHEMDITLVDYASDKRAPTPTASVEILLPKKDDLLINILDIQQKLQTYNTQILNNMKQQLSHQITLSTHLLESFYMHKMQSFQTLTDKIHILINTKIQTLQNNIPALPSLQHFIEIYKQKLSTMENTLMCKTQLYNLQAQLNQYIQLLEVYSYTKVLQRGFCIALDVNDSLISNSSKAKDAKHLKLCFSDGTVDIK